MSWLGRTLADLALRNARAMSAAQDRYETAPEPDEDLLTADDAEMQACNELMATPALCADALAKLADPEWSRNSDPRERPGWTVHDVAALQRRSTVCVSPETMQTHELVALLMRGDDAAAMYALHELRERIEHALQDDIAERASELLAAQELELLRQRSDYESTQWENAA